MIKKTQGVVLNKINYGESSLIVHLFTLEHGKHAFIVNGVRNKKRNKSALYQAGQYLDLDFYHSEKSNIWRIKEASIHIVFQRISQSIIKIGIQQYMLELIKSCLQVEHDPEPKFYQFIKDTFNVLEESDNQKCAMLPILFIWHMTAHIGLFPNIENESRQFFDLQEGRFTDVPPLHKAVIVGEYNLYFQELLSNNYSSSINAPFPKQVRIELMNAAHTYLQYHLHGFQIPRSHEIFKELL